MKNKRIGIALMTAVSMFVLTGCVEKNTKPSKPKVQKTANQHKVYGNVLIKTFSVDPKEKDDPEKYLNNKVKSYLNSIKNLRDYSVSISTSTYSDVESKGYNRVDTDATIFYTVTLVRDNSYKHFDERIDNVEQAIDEKAPK